MSRNTVLELILVVSVASIWISGVLALPQYLDAYNTTFNTNASCDICHVNPAGGGTLNSYGMLFQNQTNHASDPSAALQAIGSASGSASVTTPGATATGATTTATSMVTAISTATPIATAPPIIATPALTETSIAVETQVIATPVPTPTPSTPGFGLGVFIAGLLACYFILKRRNNN